MDFKYAFKNLTLFEIFLWTISSITVTLSFVFSADKNPLTLIASLVGVTALIFVAKGLVLGQALTVVFAVLYGIVSIQMRYYGELITYMGMSAPIAAFSVISWIRHPYRESKVVEVNRMKARSVLFLLLLSLAVTVAFYFILGALNTANLIVSTVSVTTSFLAAALSFMRSPYYAAAYALNDIVLIVLWIMASVSDISYLPMTACFVAFLANDIYGFFNWKRIGKRQIEEALAAIKTSNAQASENAKT